MPITSRKSQSFLASNDASHPSRNPPDENAVYIIDDDVPVRRAISRLIRASGFTVSAFSSVEEFLKCHVEYKNACVIADVIMNGASGLDLPDLLANSGRAVPVILMTANDSNEARQRARKAGAAGYFRKPVDDQALIDSIRWALSENVNPKTVGEKK